MRGLVREFLASYPDSSYGGAARALLIRLSRQPFTVETEPAGAQVRILNIEERYRPGMELPAGEYRVEASFDGHETAVQTVRHGAGPTSHRIALRRSVVRRSDRVALVVGNGAYDHTSRLANPTNDAADIAHKLRAVGFDVIVGKDLRRDALYAKVKEFADESESADVSLFYYSGHGMQMDEKNYLVPVDAALAHKSDVSQRMVALDDVMSQMGGETNLVFLDACRNNPLAERLARAMGTSRAGAATRGLAKVSVAREALIAFATHPGGVAADGDGRNSPFTTALLQHMGEPGLSINELLFRVNGEVRSATKNSQRPWSISSLTRVFQFADDG